MTRIAAAILIGAIVLPALPAEAQTSRVPSVYDHDCQGLLCVKVDPRTEAAPLPPCQGLLCGMTPYSLQPPMTAAEAQRIQAERAQAEAAAAAQAEAAKPARKARHAKAKGTKAKSRPMAARTPDPSAPPPAAPAQ